MKKIYETLQCISKLLLHLQLENFGNFPTKYLENPATNRDIINVFCEICNNKSSFCFENSVFLNIKSISLNLKYCKQLYRIFKRYLKDLKKSMNMFLV